MERHQALLAVDQGFVRRSCAGWACTSSDLALVLAVAVGAAWIRAAGPHGSS